MLPGPFLSFFNPKAPSWPCNQLPGCPALCGGRGVGAGLRLQAVAPGALPRRPYCVLFRPVLACQTACSRPPNGPFRNRLRQRPPGVGVSCRREAGVLCRSAHGKCRCHAAAAQVSVLPRSGRLRARPGRRLARVVS